MALVEKHLQNEEWDDLIRIGSLPISSFCPADQSEAGAWLVRTKVTGLWGDSNNFYQLSTEAREGIKYALGELPNFVEALHKNSLFDLFLFTRDGSIEHRVDSFQRLKEACLEITNIDWICKLRQVGLVLMRPYDYGFTDLSAAQRNLLATLPQISIVLESVYSIAEDGDTLSDEEVRLIRIMKLELAIIDADPWDRRPIIEAIRKMPSPTADQFQKSIENSSRQSVLSITPDDWAFLWEIDSTRFEDYKQLLNSYPKQLPSNLCEGLRLIVESVIASPSEVDEFFLGGMKKLIDGISLGVERLGETITSVLPDGLIETDLRTSNLRMPSIEDSLLHIAESTPEAFPRQSELLTLYRIFNANISYSPIEDEDGAAESDSSLSWLCAQSIPFEFAAAFAVRGLGNRMYLLLDALTRAVESGIALPQDYFAGSLDDEDLDADKVEPVLGCLDRLAQVRERIEGPNKGVWAGVIGSVFSALSSQDKHRASALHLARQFEDDLLEAEEFFRLAYLEHVAGDAAAALRYYVLHIDSTEEVGDAALDNVKLLCQQVAANQSMEFADILVNAESTSKHPSTIRGLSTLVQARISQHERQAQFEQTAINRWPSITGPARKVLGVLSSIQRYESFQELGQYAGMDATWAERHYKKLVETGMILLSENGYRINPHIGPHLARESQHSVIGRIVRSRGTSAVKQVFNSQREFSIYQVMVQLCPNHLVFPNSSLQSIMSFERVKELVSDDDFSYYLRASVDLVVVSSTSYLPMLAIEVDSVWHDTERQQKNDEKKDRLFAAAGIPFMRLRPAGSPSQDTIRVQVAEHLDELVRSLRDDLPGYEQARGLLKDLSGIQ